MNRNSLLSCALLVLMAGSPLWAQNKEPRSGYAFTVINDLKTTPVKDQQSVGTCWDHATVSFLESELLRMGKGTYDLSELQIAKNAYYEKGVRYIQFHGKTNFSEGGQAHDVIAMIRKYGLVPQEAYEGRLYDMDFHIHSEMVDALKGILDGVNRNANGRLTNTWTKGFNAYIEAYLGAVPEKFTYNGQEYTPETFRESLGLDLDDYVEITSFKAFPFYEQTVLPIPDNWGHGSYYNVPLEDLMNIMAYSLEKGYTVCWDGDVSHKGFSHGNGLALLPTNNPQEMINSEISKWTEQTAEGGQAQLNPFRAPVPEMKVDDDLRQMKFDNRLTTDDHLMHITGMLKDQHGTVYYKTKNSWAGNSNDLGGYLYMSDPFCRLQTVAIMVHKDAIPKDIRKKLGI